MATSYRKRLLQSANKILGFSGLELIKKDREFQDYIPLKDTLLAAENAGLSLGDYIDNNFNVPGATQLTIDKMLELGAFRNKVERVCEIGPGSGRYLEKVIERCNPEYYEIYETSQNWKNWLVQKYGVTAQNTDGKSLGLTPSKSIDLVHTHKMLYGNSILTICRYFQEMARIVRDNGHIVFDIMTEQCMSKEILEKWFSSGEEHACSMTAKQYTIDFFADCGINYTGSFLIPLSPGITEYLVFQKG